MGLVKCLKAGSAVKNISNGINGETGITKDLNLDNNYSPLKEGGAKWFLRDIPVKFMI